MSAVVLAPDCGRCAALCCIGLAFDRSSLFAYDKPAGEPCRHLCPDDRCAIHDRLATAGFGGCIKYDCLGAGQRVVQEIFAGRSWRDEPALLGPMMDALRVLRRVHELIALLEEAARLPLSAAQAARRQALVETLSPETGWTQATLARFEASGRAEAVRTFLEGLRDVAPAPAATR